MPRSNIVKGLERGVQVLRALQMKPDSSLHDIHLLTRISKPSLLRILQTLQHTGIVTRRLADGRYRIGANSALVSPRRDPGNRIAEAAAPILERLCRRLSWPSDMSVPAGDHMEICETSRSYSPFLLERERIGLPINWLRTAVGRVYLAYCPEKERLQILTRLRDSDKPEDRLARDPKRFERFLNETRERGYGIRDPAHTGGFYGGPPHADGLASIAVPVASHNRLYGSLNMLWLAPAYTVEAFAAMHLADLRGAAAEIASALSAKRAKKYS